MSNKELTILFDGRCPLCRREISFLRSKDKKQQILLIDINSDNYKPELFFGITYREAMKRIHGIKSSGLIVKDINVFREAYELIGFGLIYAPKNWSLIKPIFDWIYIIWARYRPPLKGRKSLD